MILKKIISFIRYKLFKLSLMYFLRRNKDLHIGSSVIIKKKPLVNISAGASIYIGNHCMLNSG